MATQKVGDLVKVWASGSIDIYTNEPGKEITGIEKIEGISSIMLFPSGNPTIVYVDPRYSVDEVADEIRTLLAVQ